MVRLTTIAGTALLLNCAFAYGRAHGEPKPSVAWEVAKGVQTPESVCFDPASGLLYVSNIGTGGPTGRDGDGFLSILNLDGEIVNPKWITGLDAPKGMRIQNGTLWVSDIDRIVAVDIAAGKVLRKISVPGATFLNDVACGPDSTVFVSDMINSRIIACRDGKVSVFAEGDRLECPNGLLVLDGRLLVAAWGREPAADFSTRTPGRLLSVDLKTKKVSPITKQPAGNLDGLESDGAGGFYATDWIAGKILHIDADGAVKLVVQMKQGTADLACVPARQLLIVPQMLENKVTALKVGR